MILQFLIALFAIWINRYQEQAIAYLQEENRIRKVKLQGRRLYLTDMERRRLAVLAHPIDRKRLKEVSSIATPDTLQCWYRRLVVQAPTYKTPRKQPRRPRVAAEIEQLVVRMAEENPRWGYRRIQGALSNLGDHIDKMTVRHILRRNHIAPAPIRGKSGMRWSQFLTLHWDVLQETDFFAAQRATFTYPWTVVRKRVRTLGARYSRLAGCLRYDAMSVLTLWTRQCHALWAGCFADRDTRCPSVFGRRWHVSVEPLPRLRLVSSQAVSLRCQASLMEHERSPPGARNLGRTRSCPPSCGSSV